MPHLANCLFLDLVFMFWKFGLKCYCALQLELHQWLIKRWSCKNYNMSWLLPRMAGDIYFAYLLFNLHYYLVAFFSILFSLGQSIWTWRCFFFLVLERFKLYYWKPLFRLVWVLPQLLVDTSCVRKVRLTVKCPIYSYTWFPPPNATWSQSLLQTTSTICLAMLNWTQSSFVI